MKGSLMKLLTYVPAIAAGLLASQLLSGGSLSAATPTPSIKTLTTDSSIQIYCRSVRINTIVVPDFCSMLALGEKLYSQGDLQGAVSSYDRALEMNPKVALAYYNRGVCRYALGDKQGGIKDIALAKDMLLSQGDLANYESTLTVLNQIQES
jgi:tetratricopeptide (TPR) repeat protein